MSSTTKIHQGSLSLDQLFETATTAKISKLTVLLILFSADNAET